MLVLALVKNSKSSTAGIWLADETKKVLSMPNHKFCYGNILFSDCFLSSFAIIIFVVLVWIWIK